MQKKFNFNATTSRTLKFSWLDMEFNDGRKLYQISAMSMESFGSRGLELLLSYILWSGLLSSRNRHSAGCELWTVDEFPEFDDSASIDYQRIDNAADVERGLIVWYHGSVE